MKGRYRSLDMLNVKMMMLGSGDVLRWRCKELDRRDACERHGGIVSRNV